MKVALGSAVAWMIYCAVGVGSPEAVVADEIGPTVAHVAPVGIARERAELVPDAGGAYWKVQCAARDRETIRWLYSQFLAKYFDDPVVHAANLSGCVLRTRCDVRGPTRLTKRQSPFTRNWLAELQLHYLVGLKRSDAFGLSMSNSYATTVDSMKVRARSAKVGVVVEWYAEEQVLLVFNWDPDSPADYGPQVERGEYIVTARSLNSGLSGQQDVELGFSTKGKQLPEVSVSASSYQVQHRKRLRIQSDGVEYSLGYGFASWGERTRNNGSALAEITFTSEMMSDASLTLTQTAQEWSVEFQGSRAFVASGTLKDGVGGGDFERHTETVCGISCSAIPYSVSWEVWPVLDDDAGEAVPEGRKAQVRRVIDTATNTAQYRPLSRQGLSWKFMAAPANGETGATISVVSNATGIHLTKHKYCVTT